MTFIGGRQWGVAWEVFGQYSNIDKHKFVSCMEERAKDTSLPFKAYDAAHAVCAELLGNKEKQ
jgi:hypothetical protein